MRFSLKTELSHKAAIKNWVVREFDLKNRSRSNLVRLVDEINAQGVPVKEACQWLQICRSSYYRWKQGLAESSEDPAVEQIRAFQEAHNYAYGAKRMAVYLSRLNSTAVNHKRVARLMKLHGLNSRVRPKRRYFLATGSEPVHAGLLKDLLQRNFKSEGLLEKMVTDMTFIPVIEGWLVLSAIKDLYSRKVVSYAFGASATIDLAMETLRGLSPQDLQGASAPLLHSDRGSCYTSEVYREAVSGMGISCSYSRPGNCHDNACIESFFGHLKSETFYSLSPAERFRLTRDEAKKIIANYIEWYNVGRLQKSIGYRSPSDFISSSGALRV